MSKKKLSGRLLIISAPSGSGKTTVVARLLKTEAKLVRSISATTRPKRGQERNGRDYRFLSRAQFMKEKSHKGFLESARILGHWYGTPRGPVERALKQGKDVIMGIDIQGAAQVRRSKLPVTTIFLLPPSLQVLRKRLKGRGTETQKQIQARLRLAKKELKAVGQFDYAVVNDSLAQAVAQIQAIRQAEHCRVES